MPCNLVRNPSTPYLPVRCFRSNSDRQCLDARNDKEERSQLEIQTSSSTIAKTSSSDLTILSNSSLSIPAVRDSMNKLRMLLDTCCLIPNSLCSRCMACCSSFSTVFEPLELALDSGRGCANAKVRASSSCERPPGEDASVHEPLSSFMFVAPALVASGLYCRPSGGGAECPNCSATSASSGSWLSIAG